MASPFFSIIHAAIIEDGELKFGKEMSDVAVITIPNGKVWHVQLREGKGEILFGKGWKEFMDYFPLGFGHFLTFEYEGIHVFMFLYMIGHVEMPNHRSVSPASATEGVGDAENLEILGLRPVSSIPLPASSHVPVGFKVFREVNRDILALRGSEGRTWDVGISTYPEKQTKLMTGWSNFVMDNRLEVGDVCNFELIDRNNLKMGVTIMQADDVV
ncbi:hypothetical protein MKW92_018431 [Papaver armeniacum]|nr:hypothetical protein MKW92_018431 [Papaver armeniacum]